MFTIKKVPNAVVSASWRVRAEECSQPPGERRPLGPYKCPPLACTGQEGREVPSPGKFVTMEQNPGTEKINVFCPRDSALKSLQGQALAPLSSRCLGSLEIPVSPSDN